MNFSIEEDPKLKAGPLPEGTTRRGKHNNGTKWKQSDTQSGPSAHSRAPTTSIPQHCLTVRHPSHPPPRAYGGRMNALPDAAKRTHSLRQLVLGPAGANAKGRAWGAETQKARQTGGGVRQQQTRSRETGGGEGGQRAVKAAACRGGNGKGSAE